MINEKLYIGQHRAEEADPAYTFTQNLIESYEFRTGKPLAADKVTFGLVWDDLNARVGNLTESRPEPRKIGHFIGRLLDR